jgi:hypothetical protein
MIGIIPAVTGYFPTLCLAWLLMLILFYYG